MVESQLHTSPDPFDLVALIAKNAPLHVQIRESLRQQILTGVYKPGDRIPSEEDLANTWKVSRLTARRSVSDLVNEGMLQRRAGVGTFLIGKKFLRDISSLVSFWESTKAQGMVPSAKLIGAELIKASPDIAGLLEIQEEEPIFRICRLRLADQDVMAYHIVHIPAQLFPDLLRQDLEKLSLYTLYRTSGCSPFSGEQRIKAIAADDEIAVLLQVPAGAPVLLLERISRSTSGKPIELLSAYHRSDRHVVYMPLQLSGRLDEMDPREERG
jgi:GntR family transcriptional regulator